MVKTASIIENDFYQLLKDSELAKEIKGNLCIGSRLHNSKTEDAVISFLAGVNGDIQKGVINLNVYVPDIIAKDTHSYKNHIRCVELENAITNTIEAINKSEYYITVEDTIKVFPESENKQHFINVRLNYKR